MTDQTMTPEQALTRAQTLVGKLRGKHVAGSLSLDEQMELGLCWQTLRAALSRPVVPEGLVAGYAAVYEGRICHEFFNATPEGLRADTAAAGYDAPEAIVALYPDSVKDERDVLCAENVELRERAEFEAWGESIGFCVTGKYAETLDVLCAESAFKAGYKAGRAAPAAQPASTTTAPSDENGGHRLLELDHETALALADAPRSLRNYVAALQAERDRLHAATEELLDALRQIAEWPDGGERYGQGKIKRFVQDVIDAAMQEGE